MRWFVVVAMVFIAQAVNADRQALFAPKLYLEDELIYIGAPSTARYYTNVIAGGNNDTIYAGELTFPQGTGELPTQASVETACATAAAGSPSSITIDIESWSTTTQADRFATRDKTIQVMKWCVGAAPAYNGKIGFYGHLPGRDFWNALDCDIPGDVGCATWRSNNDELNYTAQLKAEGITTMLFPSVYHFYPDPAPYTDTVEYITTNLAEARRLCSFCPMAPFIWPQFHEGGSTLRLVANISSATPAVLTNDVYSGTNSTNGIFDGYTIRLFGKQRSVVSISNASVGVVTCNSHGFSTGQRVVFQTTGALPTGIVAGTTYWVRNPQQNTFYLAQAPTGQVTISLASPGVFTLNSHGLTTDQPVFIHAGTLPTGMNVNGNQVYYVQNVTTNTFTLSEGVGNANPVNTSGSQSGTHYVSKAVSTSGTPSGTHTVYSGIPSPTTSPASVSAGLYRVKNVASTTLTLWNLDGSAVDGSTLGAFEGGIMQAEIPYGLWKASLDAVKQYTERAVIWGGYLQPWVKDSDWWDATRDYVQGR